MVIGKEKHFRAGGPSAVKFRSGIQPAILNHKKGLMKQSTTVARKLAHVGS
jgi:hypothetical protein